MIAAHKETSPRKDFACHSSATMLVFNGAKLIKISHKQTQQSKKYNKIRYLYNETATKKLVCATFYTNYTEKEKT